uniref:hypothetical protein n=1 Tax=Roseivirga sp. TaxID=1964215 RepID=UPI004047CC16
MKWLQILALEHTEINENHTRTVFDRDFDRIIFSHPFIKLQDKTKFNPMSGLGFVDTLACA